MHPNNKLFINEAIEKMKAAGVTVRLNKKASALFVDGTSVNGYYSENGKKRIFALAAKESSKLWFPVFVHEYCHFLQYRDDYFTQKMEDAQFRLDNWLSKKNKMSLRERQRCARVVRDFELDCEKRVVRLIKKRKLDIDRKSYVQKANVYLLFHNILPEKGWFEDNCKSPESIPGVIELMPSRFLSNYDNTPAIFRQLVLKHCYKQ